MGQERNQSEDDDSETKTPSPLEPTAEVSNTLSVEQSGPGGYQETEHSKDPIPKQGRLAGIDYGTVRMGIAVCDPSQTWVTPYETWNRQPLREQSYFLELVRRESLVGVIVGLPLHNDGRESQKSQESRNFAAWLRKTTHLPIVLFDERFSTSQAQRLLEETGLSKAKKKAKLDQIAAHIILESYLESARKGLLPPQSLDDFQGTTDK